MAVRISEMGDPNPPVFPVVRFVNELHSLFLKGLILFVHAFDAKNQAQLVHRIGIEGKIVGADRFRHVGAGKQGDDGPSPVLKSAYIDFSSPQPTSKPSTSR